MVWKNYGLTQNGYRFKMDQAYTHLSHFYDQLIEVDYDQWLTYLKQTWERFRVNPKNVLELGCGTGNITIPLANKGYNVTAVDLSEQMLERAREKAAQSGVKVDFYKQDMRSLALNNHKYDLIISCCDAFNYLTTKDDLQATMIQAYNHTNTGGLFLFDLNSEYKLRELYGNQAYADLFDDYAYFWDNYFDEEAETCQMDLTFFIRTDKDLYRRESERHYEKLWRPAEVFHLLQNSGWQLKGYFGFNTWEEPDNDSERWQFVAQKP